jgi:glyoxylase-like metal-dependent hydrolase (beta-lactamase superfamily II)
MLALTRSLILIVLVLFAQTLPASDFLDQSLNKIQLKKTHLRGNIYILEGVGGFAGGNIGVSAGEDGLLIVDDQLEQMSAKIEKALAEFASGDLKFILNTHWHGDHTGSNAYFSNDATIIAHDNVRKRLMSPQHNHFGRSPAQPKAAWPVITFDESLTIYFNNEEIHFIHLPHGHTDGDGVVFFKQSNVVHMGDHLFTNLFPFVDLNSGGNVVGFTENIAKIIELLPQDVIVIPGHGKITDLDGLKSYHQMLVETTQFVKSQVDQGEALEDIQLEGLPDKWESWGGGFIQEEKWIEFIYNSL